jgi:hypothetical protein
VMDRRSQAQAVSLRISLTPGIMPQRSRARASREVRFLSLGESPSRGDSRGKERGPSAPPGRVSGLPGVGARIWPNEFDEDHGRRPDLSTDLSEIGRLSSVTEPSGKGRASSLVECPGPFPHCCLPRHPEALGARADRTRPGFVGTSLGLVIQSYARGRHEVAVRRWAEDREARDVGGSRSG